MIATQNEAELTTILSEIALCLSEIKQESTEKRGSDFLTVREASKYLNVSDSLLRKWLFKNQIKSHRFGRCIRFNKTDLNHWVGKMAN